MRIRSIKPEFWKSERVASLSRDSRLLFIGLWNLADDAGRFRAHPSLIQGELFPYEPASDIEGWLRPLVDAGLVTLYEVDGRRYGHVAGFAEHQRIDKRTESRLPPPPGRRRAAKSPDQVPPEHGVTQCSAEKSVEPADQSVGHHNQSAEPAERSVADWSREQGGDQGEDLEQGKEQAPDARAYAREGPVAARPDPDQAPDPDPATTMPVVRVQRALLFTGLRSKLGGFLRSRALMQLAETLLPTGITPDDVAELWLLAQRKTRDDPGGLLDEWLMRSAPGTWRGVLDEQRGKAKQADLRRRAPDALDGIYGGDAPQAAGDGVAAVLAAARPAGVGA